MKKNFLASILLIMVICLAVPITSNAASQKTAVNKSIKNFMTASKKFNISKMNTYLYRKKDKLSTSVFKQLPHMTKYIKKYNKKMSYKILSTKVSGKNATVKIKVKYVNAKPFTDIMLGYMLVDAFNGKDADSYKYIDSLFKRSLNKKVKLSMQTKTITVKMIKSNGKWKIKNLSNKLHNIILADFSDAFDKTVNDFNK